MARQVQELDSHAVRELKLFIDNDGELYTRSTVPTIKSLLKKWRSGRYDQSKSVQAWRYLADAGAKKYQRDMGDRTPWNVVFPTQVRQAVAMALAEDFAAAASTGDYDDLLPLTGYEALLRSGAPLVGVDERTRRVGPFRAVRARFEAGGKPIWFWFATDPARGMQPPWYADARTLPALVAKLRAAYPDHMRDVRGPWKLG